MCCFYCHFLEEGHVNDYYWDGIRVNGASGHLSQVDIDGLKMTYVSIYFYKYGFNFYNYASIVKLDNISMTPYLATVYNNASYFKFTNCTNITFGDTAWDTIEFAKATGTNGYNIDLGGTNCNAAPAISVSGSGSGYGSSYDNDPNAKLTWN